MTDHPPMAGLAELDAEDRSGRATTLGHLAECAACRRKLTRVRELRAAAAAVTAPIPPDDLLDRILSRHRAGERVILPTADPVEQRSRPDRRLLPIAFAASVVVALGVAAQWIRGRPENQLPAPPTVEVTQSPNPTGIAFLPTRDPVDIEVVDASPAVEIDVALADEPDLRLKGEGAAASALFRIAGGNVSATGLSGGRLVITLPRTSHVIRLFINGQLELTSDGRRIRSLRPPRTTERITIVVGPEAR